MYNNTALIVIPKGKIIESDTMQGEFFNYEIEYCKILHTPIDLTKCSLKKERYIIDKNKDTMNFFKDCVDGDIVLPLNCDRHCNPEYKAIRKPE